MIRNTKIENAKDKAAMAVVLPLMIIVLVLTWI
jgi:diacylglycerol kinase